MRNEGVLGQHLHCCSAVRNGAGPPPQAELDKFHPLSAPSQKRLPWQAGIKQVFETTEGPQMGRLKREHGDSRYPQDTHAHDSQ